MNIKGFKRMLFGEKMPDKDDPQYKERYEREVQAGHKFAKATRIDQAAAKVQGFANAHRTLFLVIPLGNCVQTQSGKSHGDGKAGFSASGTAQAVAGSRNKGT